LPPMAFGRDHARTPQVVQEPHHAGRRPVAVPIDMIGNEPVQHVVAERVGLDIAAVHPSAQTTQRRERPSHTSRRIAKCKQPCAVAVHVRAQPTRPPARSRHHRPSRSERTAPTLRSDKPARQTMPTLTPGMCTAEAELPTHDDEHHGPPGDGQRQPRRVAAVRPGGASTTAPGRP
jgi:hypothetical protein